MNLTHCNLPVYLGVTLDRTLSYKAHIENTKNKVGTRNNIIRKLRNSKWGATPTTLRSSALALCYSAAEYACPVWERSTHAKKLNATLNETCRMITGCLKPTNTNSLPILAGIAPSVVLLNKALCYVIGVKKCHQNQSAILGATAVKRQSQCFRLRPKIKKFINVLLFI